MPLSDVLKKIEVYEKKEKIQQRARERLIEKSKNKVSNVHLLKEQERKMLMTTINLRSPRAPIIYSYQKNFTTKFEGKKIGVDYQTVLLDIRRKMIPFIRELKYLEKEKEKAFTFLKNYDFAKVIENQRKFHYYNIENNLSNYDSSIKEFLKSFPFLRNSLENFIHSSRYLDASEASKIIKETLAKNIEKYIERKQDELNLDQVDEETRKIILFQLKLYKVYLFDHKKVIKALEILKDNFADLSNIKYEFKILVAGTINKLKENVKLIQQNYRNILFLLNAEERDAVQIEIEEFIEERNLQAGSYLNKFYQSQFDKNVRERNESFKEKIELSLIFDFLKTHEVLSGDMNIKTILDYATGKEFSTLTFEKLTEIQEKIGKLVEEAEKKIMASDEKILSLNEMKAKNKELCILAETVNRTQTEINESGKRVKNRVKKIMKEFQKTDVKEEEEKLQNEYQELKKQAELDFEDQQKIDLVPSQYKNKIQDLKKLCESWSTRTNNENSRIISSYNKGAIKRKRVQETELENEEEEYEIYLKKLRHKFK